MNVDILKISLSALIAISGWWIGHYLSWLLDRKQKLRDTRVTYLQGVLQDLIRLRSYANVLSIDEVAALLVGVLSSIELYGTDKQINLFHEILASVTIKGGQFGLSETLIDNLRDDLRSEIKLDSVDGSVTYLDFGKDRGIRPVSELSYEVLSTGETISYDPKMESPNL